MENYQELISQATVIKNENGPRENTALRVGSTLVNIINGIKGVEENMSKDVSDLALKVDSIENGKKTLMVSSEVAVRTIGSTATLDLTANSPKDTYAIKIDQNGVVDGYRLVGYKAEGGSDILVPATSGIPQYIVFETSREYNRIRIVFDPQFVIGTGNVSATLFQKETSIYEMLEAVHEDIEANTESIRKNESDIADVNERIDELMGDVRELQTKSVSCIANNQNVTDFLTDGIAKGDYYIQVSQSDAVVNGFRLIGFKEEGGNEAFLTYTMDLSEKIKFTTTRDYTKLRVSFDGANSLKNGNVNVTISTFAVPLTERLEKAENAIESMQPRVDSISRPETDIITHRSNVTSNTTNYIDVYISLKQGKYNVSLSNDGGEVSSFRLVAYGTDPGSIPLLAHPQKIGVKTEIELPKDIVRFRFIIESQYVIKNGFVLINVTSPSYSIIEDLDKLKDDVNKLKNAAPDILFPVPSDIYCATGVDMNLYYANMYGMIDGQGYMFIDSPNVVYDTTAAETGSYDGFCNFDRQLHFKPNTAGTMQLYFNVWNDYMGQVASKISTLHIVNPSVLNGKSINMLVNGSSSIDMGTFQSEIKNLLEQNGATVNMVGRWASGNNLVTTAYNNKAENRLSENRSGGSSEFYVTKANATKTQIVHPTNITDTFCNYASQYTDGAGNKWEIWGNSSSFVELVLLSGNISTLPTSGILTKVAGTGIAQINYDRLITNVPQTTNPFWSDSKNGISFTEYCSNWNRPTPNVLVTLWGTNDIGGSGGNIATGKQWATDAQINTFVARQRKLVDAFLRDCPNGVFVMCPQPTGSLLSGKKNSDKNGMLYSKLKATQALMDEFKNEVASGKLIIVPVLWWFDRINAYNGYGKTLSKRMSDFYSSNTLDIVTDDSTHPQARGYYQMADAVFSAITYWFSK